MALVIRHSHKLDAWCHLGSRSAPVALAVAWPIDFAPSTEDRNARSRCDGRRVTVLEPQTTKHLPGFLRCTKAGLAGGKTANAAKDGTWV